MRYLRKTLHSRICQWIESRRARELCGIFPADLPIWFPLTPCCANHDIAYVSLRNEALWAYLDDPDPDRILGAWLVYHYYLRVKAIDRLFCSCLEDFTNKAPRGLGWLYGCSASLFMRLVNQRGWSIWLEGTVELIHTTEEYLTNSQ